MICLSNQIKLLKRILTKEHSRQTCPTLISVSSRNEISVSECSCIFAATSLLSEGLIWASAVSRVSYNYRSSASRCYRAIANSACLCRCSLRNCRISRRATWKLTTSEEGFRVASLNLLQATAAMTLPSADPCDSLFWIFPILDEPPKCHTREANSSFRFRHLLVRALFARK